MKTYECLSSTKLSDNSFLATIRIVDSKRIWWTLWLVKCINTMHEVVSFRKGSAFNGSIRHSNGDAFDMFTTVAIADLLLDTFDDIMNSTYDDLYIENNGDTADDFEGVVAKLDQIIENNNVEPASEGTYEGGEIAFTEPKPKPTP